MTPRFLTLPEIRRAARDKLPREVWNFGDGGAETETTLRRNRRGLRRLAIRQHVLADVRSIDLSTTLLGFPLEWPVAIAPMGGLVLFHPEGDVEMARGAALADTLQFLSGAAGWPVEDVAAANPGLKMFQLYHHGDRGWVAELLARVEASGYGSVVLTVDVALYGRRERDIAADWSPREAMSIAPNPRGPDPSYQARLTWDDVDWLRKTTKLPIGLKGIMTVRDASEVIGLNRKQRNKMSVVKEGLQVTNVIVQEGVHTFETVNEGVAEPVIYMVDHFVVGGFYRVHTQRGVDENLNAPGMHFEPLPFDLSCTQPDFDANPDCPPNRFYTYGVIARLALLAASIELERMEQSSAQHTTESNQITPRQAARIKTAIPSGADSSTPAPASRSRRAISRLPCCAANRSALKRFFERAFTSAPNEATET